MANILVCVEGSDANREAGNYYSKSIDPGLTLLGHQSKLTTCEYAKDVLEGEQTDILLFLVSRKQSSCWQIANGVRNGWRLPNTPAILVVVKWGPEDSPEYPAYFNQPEYLHLYDDYYEGFTGVPWWVNDFLTRKKNGMGPEPGNGKPQNVDAPIVMSNLNDIFRYADTKQNHLTELLHQHNQLIPHLYVIDGEGNIRVGQIGHHNLLVEGGNVYGAGEIFFTRKKQIVRVDDQTGNYYAPAYQGKTFGQQFKDYLKRLLKDHYQLEVDDPVFRGTM